MYRLIKITLDGLAKSHIQFSAIPREAVDQITDSDALAVYMYLMSKPPNWDVREPDICEKRGLTQERLIAAMLILKKLGYIANDPYNPGILRISMVSTMRLQGMPAKYFDRWQAKPKTPPTGDDAPF